MENVGIVAEFDPLHRGHQALLNAVRQRWPNSAVTVALSGHFTQRGSPADLRPAARAEMAIRSGADLVLELPLPWAAASAESFGWGGAAVLRAAGAQALAFGSESGQTDWLRAAALALEHPHFSQILRENLQKGISFAAARQAAVTELAGLEVGAVLCAPNDTLGVSYLAAARSMDWEPELLCFPRQGAAHNAPAPEEGISSASYVRELLRSGSVDEAAALLPSESAAILRREWEAGLCPADLHTCERAVLYRLRTMTPDDFQTLPDCSEGLENRLYRAAGAARSLEEFYGLVRSKRCPHARVRRLTLWAFLGLRAEDRPKQLLYVRVLGFNERGRQVLRDWSRRDTVPLLTKPSEVRRLDEAAQRLMELEALGADLWRLCLPGLEHSAAGGFWREGPVRVEE